MERTHYIVTEDDVKVYEGDLVYNYYDMRPGVIRMRDRDKAEIDKVIEANRDKQFRINAALKKDIWLELAAMDGDGNIIGTDLMNGERICSVAFAKRRGFRGA